MRVLVNVETGSLEIGCFVDKAPTLCAQSYMFEHGQVDTAPVYKSTSSLLIPDKSSAWIKKHGTAPTKHERM